MPKMDNETVQQDDTAEIGPPSQPALPTANFPTEDEIAHYVRLNADHGADAICILGADGRALYINAGFERLTGLGPKEVIGKRAEEFLVLASDAEAIHDNFDRDCRSKRTFTTENKFRHKDGHSYWMENHATPIFDEDGNMKYLLCNSRETTERKQMSQQLERSLRIDKARQRERHLLSQVTEWLYSAKSMEELTLVISKSLQTLFPDATGQLFTYANSRDVLDLLSRWNGGQDQNHVDPDDCWSLRRGRAYSFGLKTIEFPCAHSNKSGLPYFCLPIVAQGQTNGLLHLQFNPKAFANLSKEQIMDYTQNKWQLALLCAEQISLSIANVQLRQELLDQSIRDPLTNLWNRRWLLEAANKEMIKSRRTKSPFSILSIDVDHFKEFNDHHGHDAGDLVLRAIGTAMLDFFATDAAPCRMGGEEFLVLCPNLDADEAAFLAEQLRKKISDVTVNHSGTILPTVTLSIGIASFPTDATELVDLLNVADRAMYEAKDAGRNQTVVFKTPVPTRHSRSASKA